MNKTKLYYAPLEGITDPAFRSIHATLFPNSVDAYYTPFFSPTYDSPFSEREAALLSPEKNSGVQNLIPQILTNQAPLLVDMAEKLCPLGFSELNLNLGCPSGTVVSKKKGAGFLSEPDMLDRFFDEVFSSPVMRSGALKLSVKTRLGMLDTAEFGALLDIYNRYPISLLIVHPRVRAEQYGGVPHTELFSKIIEKTAHPLCYNGDIFTRDDLLTLAPVIAKAEKNGKTLDFMLGRGAVANPALFDVLREAIDGKAPTRHLQKKELYAYATALYEDACRRLSGDRHILFRMKELWAYLISVFDDSAEPYRKRLKKATTTVEFLGAVEGLFGACPLAENGGFCSRSKAKL